MSNNLCTLQVSAKNWFQSLLTQNVKAHSSKIRTIVRNSPRSLLWNVSRDTKHFDCHKRVNHLHEIKPGLSTIYQRKDLKKISLTSPLAVEPFGLGICCPLITYREKEGLKFHGTLWTLFFWKVCYLYYRFIRNVLQTLDCFHRYSSPTIFFNSPSAFCEQTPSLFSTFAAKATWCKNSFQFACRSKGVSFPQNSHDKQISV